MTDAVDPDDRIMSHEEISEWLFLRGITDERGKPVNERTIYEWQRAKKIPAGWSPFRRKRFTTRNMLAVWWKNQQENPSPAAARRSTPSRQPKKSRRI